MPYMREGKCVYHKNADGSKGKLVGCSDNEEMAMAHLRKMEMIAHSEHKSLSDLKLELHRKFNALLDEVDMLEALNAPDTRPVLSPSQVAEVDSEALDEFKDEHEFPELDDYEFDFTGFDKGLRPADGTIAAFSNDGKVYVNQENGEWHSHNLETIYAAPTSNDPGLFKSLTAKFQKGLQPGQSIVKAADGKRLMVITTSNSYSDREEETLTTAALKEDVDRHWTGDDAAFMSNNPLLFWHEDAAPVGDIIWADMIGPFYVELAREQDNLISKRYFDWREAHPREKWGASHRFAYYRHHRNSGGDYSHIYKQESTTLPLEESANVGTLSGVFPMSDKRAKKFDEVMGLDGAYNILKTEGYDALVAKLQAQGIEHKTIENTAQEATDKAAKDFAHYVVDMAEDIAGLSDQVEQMKSEMQAAQKSYTDKEAKLDETAQRFEDAIKSVTNLAEKLQAQLDARPTRASRAKTTEIDDGELPENVADSLLVADPFWGKVKPAPRS